MTDVDLLAGIAEDQRRGVLATIRLRIRASAGDSRAQFVLGRTLMYGSGLPAPDDERAHYWLIRALAGGHPGAARLLEIIERDDSRPA